MSSRYSRVIYVGNLPSDVKEYEIEDLFYKYGRILDIELKLPPRPPCFCFVEFESSRDAEDAIRGRDGYNFDGCRLRVELAYSGRGSLAASERRGDRGGRYGAPRRTEYRVIVRGLPTSASWQDLKDHMRKAGDVCFAEVSTDSKGTFGMVDYTNYEDMKYAIRKLDDSEFKNPWTKSYIRFCSDFTHWRPNVNLCFSPDMIMCNCKSRSMKIAHLVAVVGAEVQEGTEGRQSNRSPDLHLGQGLHLL